MRGHVLHLADLHLGDAHAWLGAGAAARRAEVDLLFRRITDHVLRSESPVGGVLLAGDLFDAHDPPAALVESVIEDLERLRRAGIRTLTVPGNHDEYSYPACVYRIHGARWPDRLVTNPSMGKVDTWRLEGVSVDLYAMAFTAGRSRPPFDAFDVEENDARKIAVIHGSLDAPWSDRSIPLRSSALASRGLDYIALGHIHRPFERRLGGAWVCYPGRIEGSGFEDPGGAGLVLVDVAGGASGPAAPSHARGASGAVAPSHALGASDRLAGKFELRPRREPFPSREIATTRWSLAGMAGPADLDARIERSADPERIQRLILDGPAGFPIDAASLQERWSGSFRFLEILVTGGESIDLDEVARERTVRGIFASVARERIGEAQNEDSVALCEAALRYGLAAFAAARKEPS